MYTVLGQRFSLYVKVHYMLKWTLHLIFVFNKRNVITIFLLLLVKLSKSSDSHCCLLVKCRHDSAEPNGLRTFWNVINPKSLSLMYSLVYTITVLCPCLHLSRDRKHLLVLMSVVRLRAEDILNKISGSWSITTKVACLFKTGHCIATSFSPLIRWKYSPI